MTYLVHHSDCLEALKLMEADSVDSIVSDPPAGIAFMGKDWDKDKGGRLAWVAWMESVATEAIRVLKPGGYALVWALPRTSHWTGWAWENAGWEVRDKLVHLFGSGFPKSLDVSKAIDKAAGVEFDARPASGVGFMNAEGAGGYNVTKNRLDRKGESTDAARQWNGWGTALKPAAEDWWLFRKPLIGTVAANVLKHGTGGINIDGCRIAGKLDGDPHRFAKTDGGPFAQFTDHAPVVRTEGRWPANVILDEDAAALLDEQTGTLTSGDGVKKRASGSANGIFNINKIEGSYFQVDSGGASRFFYTAKASRSERTHGGTVENKHPTVKAISLMRYLVRLITPPNGTVLDPFTGSGSTGVGAILEGFNFVGCEMEIESFETARERLKTATLVVTGGIKNPWEDEPDEALVSTPKEVSVISSIEDLFEFGF